MVATMLSLCLPPYLNGYRHCVYIYHYLPEYCHNIVVIYSDHAPPYVHCFSLILIGKTVQMYRFIVQLQVGLGDISKKKYRYTLHKISR